MTVTATRADVRRAAASREAGLRGRLFLGGTRPSAADAALFAELLGGRPHLSRWARHIGSYPAAERERWPAAAAPPPPARGEVGRDGAVAARGPRPRAGGGADGPAGRVDKAARREANRLRTARRGSAPAPPPALAPRPLRVLALHGKGQSGAALAERLRELARRLAGVATLTCDLDAPLPLRPDRLCPRMRVRATEGFEPRGAGAARVEPGEAGTVEEVYSDGDAEVAFDTRPRRVWVGGEAAGAVEVEGQYEWYRLPRGVDEHAAAFAEAPAEKAGIRESVAAAAGRWARGAADATPFDGVLGFSSGAQVAAMLCEHLRQRGGGAPPRFLISLSSTDQPVPSNLPGYPPPGLMRTPSLHVYGEADPVIPAELSRAFARRFDAAEEHVARHRNHHPPHRAADCDRVRAFLERFRVGAEPAAAAPARDG